MKKPYNIKLLKPMGDILIQYTEKSNSKEICLTRQEELDRIMFNEEKINIFEVLNERDLYKSIIKELRSWLEDGFGYDKGVVAEEYIEAMENVLDKLNELEGGKND